jgi:hypothetical protein
MFFSRRHGRGLPLVYSNKLIKQKSNNHGNRPLDQPVCRPPLPAAGADK